MIKIKINNINTLKMGSYIGYFYKGNENIYIINSLNTNKSFDIINIYDNGLFEPSSKRTKSLLDLIYYEYYLLTYEEINYYNKLATFK